MTHDNLRKRVGEVIESCLDVRPSVKYGEIKKRNYHTRGEAIFINAKINEILKEVADWVREEVIGEDDLLPNDKWLSDEVGARNQLRQEQRQIVKELND